MMRKRWRPSVWLLASACACSHEVAESGSSSVDASSALRDASSEPADRAQLVDATSAANDAALADPNVISVGSTSSDPAPVCTWRPFTCGDHAQSVEVVGETPYGEIRIRSVGLSYWVGFTSETQLRMEGTLGGVPMLLEVRVADGPDDRVLRPQIAPGTYRSGSAWTDLISRVMTCQNEYAFQRSELLVERHEGPTFSDGGSLRLRGSLTVSDPGWNLTIPFDVTEQCPLPE